MDDEAHAVCTLKDYVSKTDGLALAGTATDPIAAMVALKGPAAPDLLLLDVDMPGMSGLELAGMVPGSCSIIFVTAYREFGVEAFTLAAVDYLLKPIKYARFFQAVQKVKEQRWLPGVNKREYFFVKGGVKDKYVKVSFADVQYIAAAQNYIDIHLGDQRLETYLTLKEVMGKLPEQDFIQVHRSFIVNRRHIKAIENGQLRMDNDQLLSLGKTYLDAFYKWLAPDFAVSKRLL
ncbi:LytR/AlgR family response regulator transcription factor [Mucilaginibacter phyllosphaerae]